MAKSSTIGQLRTLTDPRPDAASTANAKPGKRDQPTSVCQSSMVFMTASISHLKTQQTGENHELQSIPSDILEAKSILAGWPRTCLRTQNHHSEERSDNRPGARHLSRLERKPS